MIIQKIVKFEKRAQNIYTVVYENLGGGVALLTKAEFDLAQCIDDFIRRGVDPDAIEHLIGLAQSVGFEATY